MDTAAGQVVRLSMGISHADFFRIFPRVMAPAPLARDGLRVSASPAPGKRLQVTLSEEKTRRIALLRIVHLELELHFVGYSEAERERFLVHFRRAFQKGGG